MPRKRRKAKIRKKELWFFRPQGMYQRRYHGQYGHFTRDTLLYIFWYMKKAKLLDNPRWVIKLHQRLYGYKKPFMEFVQQIFSNVEFGPAGGPWPDTPQWTGQRVMKYIPKPRKLMWIGKNLSEGRWRWTRDERFNTFVKWAVDPFRDYCFKKLNFKPEKKKRVLYVPRIAPPSNNGAKDDTYGSRSCRIENPYTHRREYPNRYVDDEIFETMLKDWCEKNQYEYVHWQNTSEIPIVEQIKMYAESDVVIGPTGTDWINSYYCDEKTLLIEIIPPQPWHTGGDCETFKSEAQLKAVRQNKYHKFPKGWDLSDACERNLKLIYQEELLEHDHIAPGIRGVKWQMVLSEKNRSDMIEMMNDHVSLSRDNS